MSWSVWLAGRSYKEAARADWTLADQMDAKAIATMLQRDRDEWNALVVVLEMHTERGLHAADSPEWNSRDVYSHLARWMDASMDQMEAHLAGRSLPPIEGTDDEINERWRSDDSGLSLDEACAKASEAYERRVRIILSVAPDRWDPVLDAIAGADGWDHYRSHRTYIVVR